jgi:hypothetical protein
MADTEFIEQLRRDLLRLLREHPEIRHELWGLMVEAFPSRQEFLELLEEMRAWRQDMNQRFEAVDRRFEAMDRRFEELRQDMNQRFEAVDRRFEAVIEELRSHGRQLREMQLHLSSLGARVGYGLEHVVREVVEEFAGQTFTFAERLVLPDDTGTVYEVAGAEVEFDLYAHNGTAYLVEVKSHLKVSDVLMFHRKVRFAESRLGRSITPLIIALSMEARAEQTMRELGVQYRIRAVMG